MANRWIHAGLAGALALGLAGCGDDEADASFPVPEATTIPGLATSGPTAGSSGAAAASTPKVAGTIATGLDAPWGLAFLPDGSALVSERDSGNIKRIAAGGKVSTVGEVPGVEHGGEGGLLGIAVGPDFGTEPRLYAYFTASDGNRVAWMTYSPTSLGAPTVILDGIESGNIHNGGRLAFGPDKMLYASTGEAGERDPSQDPKSLNGKVLRMTPDGKVPSDNPTAGSLVWTLGHRNVQGLAWDDQGQLWASELGQNTWDELNLIKPGNNYGWPEVEGDEGGSEFTRPERVWSTGDASPSGIAVAGDSVWMCALRGKRLWQIPLTGSADEPTGKPKAWFEGDHGRLRTVMLAPDGSLWLITNNTDGRGDEKAGDDRILRITLS